MSPPPISCLIWGRPEELIEKATEPDILRRIMSLAQAILFRAGLNAGFVIGGAVTLLPAAKALACDLRMELEAEDISLRAR